MGLFFGKIPFDTQPTRRSTTGDRKALEATSKQSSIQLKGARGADNSSMLVYSD